MSNTSINKTANKPTKSNKDKDKLRVIVGEIGRDTKTGILGRGYSNDNGKTFHVTDTMYGRLYDPNDIDGIWNGGTADRVKKEVDSATAEIPAAVSAANSAVSAAESAVAASKVNSDAIVAMQSAASEAQSGAAQALSDAQSAIANVASDAQAIRQHVADVESAVSADQQANSSAAEQLRSDLSVAKQNIATANDNLTKAQAAIDDSKKAIASNAAAIQSAVAQHKQDIANAQAANAKTATELASYTKQAQEQGKTITDLQKSQDSTTQTIADIKGNVTQVQQSVTTLQGALKDTNGNVDVVKAQADSLQGTLTDYQKNVASLSATAKALTASMKDAEGRLSTVEQTASTQSTTISGLKDDFSQAKQEADKLTATLKDAQGDIAQTQATAKSLSTQIESAQGDIASLQTTATSLQGTLTDHSKRIASVEARADKLESDMKDAQGNITVATQTASAAGVTASDAKSDVITAQTTASEAKMVATNANSQALKAVAAASGVSLTLTGIESTANDAASQASAAGVSAGNAQSTADQANAAAKKAQSTANGASSTANQAGINAGDAKTVASHASATASAAKTSADQATTIAGNAQSSADQAQSTANSANKTASQATVTANGAQSTATQANSKADAAQSAANANAKAITTVQASVKATQTELLGKVDKSTVDETNKRLDDVSEQVKITAGQMSSKADQTTVTGLANTVNGIKNVTEWKTVNEPVDLNNIKAPCHEFLKGTVANAPNETAWWYLTVAGSEGTRVTQTVIADQSNNYYTRRLTDDGWSAWVKQATANDVSNVQAQVTKQSTEISNNTKLINLAAKQTSVDTLNNEVKQQQAQQQIFADQIKTKLTSSDVQGILTNGKYATQTYTQALLDATSKTLNANLTEVRNEANGNHQSDVTRMVNMQASIDGLQGIVKNKANQSAVTQLANTYQIKLTGNLLASLGKKAQKYTVGNNTFFPFASIDVTKVTRGTVLTLSFDYSSDADCAFIPQLDGAPWIPWGDIKDNPISVKANVPGHYVKQITVGDDSWTKGTAKNIAIRIDNFGGTFTVSNLTLRSGDNVASTFDMLQYDMDLRVQKGDLLSQINLEAGRTLIQSQKIYMDADSVIMGPNTRAFIPSAAIINLDAAKIESGFLHTDKVAIGDNSIRLNVANNEMTFSGSSVNKYYQLSLQGNSIAFRMSGSQGYDYRIAHGVQKYETDEDGLDFDVAKKNVGSNKTVMGLSASGVMISPSLFFQTDNIDSPNWMGFTRNTVDGNTTVSFHTWDDNNEGFHVDCGARFMNYVYINGYARAQGWLTNSTLSKKTNIRKLDNQIALDKIRQDDQYLYEYKRNVAKGIYDPQASFIIDDVNDVAQYSVPREFIDQTGNYREPNVELAYLVAAFQALDKQVQEQNETIKKLEAKLNE